MRRTSPAFFAQNDLRVVTVVDEITDAHLDDDPNCFRRRTWQRRG
jgi:hypothetical protein